MEQAIDIMMQILKSAIHEIPIEKNFVPFLTQENLEEIYKISEAHDLAHIIGSTLDKYGLLPQCEVAEMYHDQEFTAVFRYERLNYEYQKICEILEKSEIEFMPLKGAIMRDFYPEPWMRTSCDIDILVHKEDLKKAQDALKNELNYNIKNQGTHDITMQSVNDICIELHYDLVEEKYAKDSYLILKNVWNYSKLKENYKYFHIMSNDIFYFYHIAHIAKHFESAGCGIRPLLDLWILNNKADFWNSSVEKMLKQAGLLRFAFAVRNLSEVWFSEEVHDEITLKMQEFILKGGVYGNEENHVLTRNYRAGGRIQYILSRIFVPYIDLKYEFPVLQKYRFLTPVFEVYRWILFIFKKNKRNKIERLNYINHIPEEQAKEVMDMMEKIGL